MIKVHCFVSCVCEVIKKTADVDHRPYYFGVWDADFDISHDYILRYHSETIDHEFFKQWYEMLYGIHIHRWYEEEKTKDENVETLLTLLQNKPENRYVMVMLDLSMLPERENKFHQSPFPHYVMLEPTANQEEWCMYDPDFRWEGYLPRERILAAIREPAVKGGYYFDAEHIHPASPETVIAYFHTCLKKYENPMTDGVRKIVQAYTTGNQQHRLHELGIALQQLPVLAIRKYAYEHAFAYFWENLCWSDEEFEAWCDEVDCLVKGYTKVQYRAMKLGMTRNMDLVQDIFTCLDEQDEREFKIKEALKQCFEAWQQTCIVSQ
ncbi:DUF6005 family protein [Ectobacillus sp. JY-23]|uniref:DUF6005 family protein n=1 Tax=Ectobacillus sp. JY-23 TaxID=2933872 RepID=UPI001FF6B484|nr:DUF6005 family protein [Ectobacillus sp. JY-23]UOY91886.1 DUF6005 family protein [Ectobacillus sp. JY-23]